MYIQAEFSVWELSDAGSLNLSPTCEVTRLHEGVRSGQRVGNSVLDVLLPNRLRLSEEVISVSKRVWHETLSDNP